MASYSSTDHEPRASYGSLTGHPYFCEVHVFARKIRTLALLLPVLLAVSAGTASAQRASFGVGQVSVGPTLGFGSINGAAIDFGVRFEKGVRELPEWGDGTLGIQGIIDWYSYDGGYSGFGYSISYLLVGGVANYHFAISNKQWDPFFGLGLGYQSISNVARDGAPRCVGCVDSGIHIIGHAGVQYFYSPKMSFYADLGTPMAALNLGVMFQMK